MANASGRETFPVTRSEYLNRHPNERVWTLARRKLLGHAQRRFFLGSVRRLCCRWMGVKIETSKEERPVWIGPEVYIDDTFPELVTLGAGAVLGVRCMILTHDDAKRIVSPVVIGRRSYVGAGALILPGVSVGDDAVVGAGAVVTKNVPAGETWIGVPARTIEQTADVSAS